MTGFDRERKPVESFHEGFDVAPDFVAWRELPSHGQRAVVGGAEASGERELEPLLRNAAEDRLRFGDPRTCSGAISELMT